MIMEKGTPFLENTYSQPSYVFFWSIPLSRVSPETSEHHLAQYYCSATSGDFPNSRLHRETGC